MDKLPACILWDMAQCIPTSLCPVSAAAWSCANNDTRESISMSVSSGLTDFICHFLHATPDIFKVNERVCDMLCRVVSICRLCHNFFSTTFGAFRIFCLAATRGYLSTCKWIVYNKYLFIKEHRVKEKSANESGHHVDVVQDNGGGRRLRLGTESHTVSDVLRTDQNDVVSPLDVRQPVVEEKASDNGIGQCKVLEVGTCLIAAATGGHLHVCMWLAKEFGIQFRSYRSGANVLSRDTWSALFGAARGGHLPVLKWLMDCCHFKVKDANEEPDAGFCLTHAAKNGHLKMCQYLVERFQLTLNQATECDGKLEMKSVTNSTFHNHLQIEVRTAFRKSASGGHLETCRWLAKHFFLIKKDACSKDARCRTALGLSISHGHLEVARWLVDHFKLSVENVRRHHNCAFAMAARHGHLKVCKWLVKTFCLTLDDLGTSHALSQAAGKGHLNVCKWLAKYFELTRPVPRMTFQIANALHTSNHLGHNAVHQWLIEYFQHWRETHLHVFL